MSSNDFQEERIYAFVAEAGMCNFYLGFKSITSTYMKNYMTHNPEESFHNHSAFYDERY